MSTLFVLTFLLGCVGIWYYIKKAPHKRNRNLSIATVIISILLIGIFGSSNDSADENTKPTTVSTSTEETTAETELILELPSEVEADENSNVLITGKTNPGAHVSIGMGILGDSTEADEDGSFSLEHSITDDSEEELTIYTTLNNESKSTKVTVKPNAQVLADKADAEARRKQAEEEQKQIDAQNEAEKKDPSTYNTGITYDQLSRNPEEFIGEKVVLSGKIIQVMESDEYTQYRLAVDSDYDRVALIQISKDQLSTRILEDDLVTIYGESYGLISYDSALSGKITVPSVIVNIFTLN
ncbi:hypothetical protein [Enterococcus sp. DIV2381]|uniref:hypothetical protein n=1 Tax=unclassified Enterococcus TaxID=2608891 RepID=UPI003D2D7E22